METPIRSYCFAFTIIFAWTSLNIIILGLIGNFVTILIRYVPKTKNQKKKEAPFFYAIRSLAVSDFIFLVLSMISGIFILTKVNNTVLYFTTGIIVTFSLVDFTFNVYPWKCSINPHLFKDEKTSINDCEPCQYQEDVLVYLWYCSVQWSLTILFNFYLDMKKLLNFNSFCTCEFYSFM